MPEYIYHYFRDGVEISRDEFSKLFDEDLEADDRRFFERHGMHIKGAVISDYGEGRECDINGHVYSTRCDYHYDTAKKLLNDVIQECLYDEIFDALQTFTEDEAKWFIQKLSRVTVDDQKFVLSEAER